MIYVAGSVVKTIFIKKTHISCKGSDVKIKGDGII